MQILAVSLSVSVSSGGAHAQTSAPERSVAIDSTDTVPYAARVRLTAGAWDFVKLTLRETFKTWGKKGQNGFNLILDPGYQYPWQANPRTAGPIRTTPFNPRQYYFWDADRASVILNACTWVVGAHCDYGYLGICGNFENNTQAGRSAITGVPGCSGPDVYAVVDNPRPANQCYKQYQFCTNYYTGDPGSGVTCSNAPLSGSSPPWYSYTAHYNARLFVFPNNFMENQADPQGLVSSMARWGYTGMWWQWYDRVGCDTVALFKSCDWSQSTTFTNDCVRCGASCNTCCGSNCFWCGVCGWSCCSCCSTDCVRCWFSCRTCTWPTGCAGYDLTQYNRYHVYSNWYPTAPFGDGVYNKNDGLFFRHGDDTAIYLNIDRMQKQTLDALSYRPDDCGFDYVYTSPGWPTPPSPTITRVRACMRPLMYWSTTVVPNRWVQCDPFDTWYSDGSYNPNNDDAKVIYPGPGYTSRTCGNQRCTASDGTVFTGPPSTWNRWPCNASPRRTWDLNDVTIPGGGWYGLRIENMALLSGSNQIDVTLRADQLRIELGAFADAQVSATLIGIPFSITITGKSVLGLLRADYLRATGHIKLYSIDNTGWSPDVNDWITNPDKLIIDVDMQASDLDLQFSSPPLSPDSWSNCFLYFSFIKMCAMTVADLLNLALPMLKDTLVNALVPTIRDGLKSISQVVPDLNTLLGDPWEFNNALIDTGLYATGSNSERDTSTIPYRYPVRIKDGPYGAYPAGKRQVADMTFALAFKPIAFQQPAGVGGVLTIDTAAVPAASSVFGVPTLYDPDTLSCGSCNTPRHPKRKDADQKYDTEDYWTFWGNKYIMPEVWGEPWIKRAKSWCVSPRQLAQTNNFAGYYPKTTWLSFDASEGTPRNTVGAWDQVWAMRQNQSNPAVQDYERYDVSVHLHQRSLAQFASAVIAAGAACLEFARQDAETGEETIFKEFLRLDRFAAFFPGLLQLFPGQERYVKVQIVPMQAPRFRAGLGSLSYTPPDPRYPAITAQPYTLGIAVPDIIIRFLVEDPTGDIEFFTLKWNTTVGLYMKAIRQCHWLEADSIEFSPQCQSTIQSLRTISGYYELFLDINSPSLGQAFERPVNMIDNFNPGTFTRKDFVCPTAGCKVMINPGAGQGAQFEVVKSICGSTSMRCKQIEFAQAVPMLLSAYISAFMATRFQFYGLTLDFLYVGPDGPNDDGVGGGDYVGAYLRFLGKLDVFGLISQLGGLFAPGAEPFPDTGVKMLQTAATSDPVPWVRENRAAFSFTGLVPPAQADATVHYSYRLDGGFWHTPVPSGASFEYLTEGEHMVEVRALIDRPDGVAYIDPTPARFKFVVDTLPPEISFREAGGAVVVEMKDLQSRPEHITASYRIDGAGERAIEPGGRIRYASLGAGRHSLVVRAQDAAGNVATAAHNIEVQGQPGLGCAAATSTDLASPWFIFMALAVLRWRRWASIRFRSQRRP